MNSKPPQFDLDAELHEIAMNRLFCEVMEVAPLFPLDSQLPLTSALQADLSITNGLF